MHQIISFNFCILYNWYHV